VGPPLGLALAVVLLSASTVSAQPLSSGSGAGTGTGMMGGAARNSTGTGQEGGTPNASGTGVESGSGLLLPGANNYINPSNARNRLLSPGQFGRGTAIPYGPGVGETMPGDLALPLDTSQHAGLIQNAATLSTVTDRHLDYARRIPTAADRSLALSRIASAATFSGQLDMAESALGDASSAGLLIPQGMVRDQRLISIITALMNLADARLREGRADAVPPSEPVPATPTPSPSPAEAETAPKAEPIAPVKLDRNDLIRRAQADWLRAADLSQRIGNPTYRSELMYRVADSMAYGSQTVVNEFPGSDPAARRGANGVNTSFEGLPDTLLQQAADLATRIDRPVWHDHALVTVTTAAAESGQFARALAVARMIPQPEVRTNALLKTAETQARRGDPAGATATYKEAAQAVASIPLDDPRTVLAGVLIDNLIAVGRFDDARASIVLYGDVPHRLIALGAIAESQGRRGAARSALTWINRDVPPEYRSQLYRRVSNGVVAAIEQNRSRDLSNRGER
jgi:hypothetical protein